MMSAEHRNALCPYRRAFGLLLAKRMASRAYKVAPGARSCSGSRRSEGAEMALPRAPNAQPQSRCFWREVMRLLQSTRASANTTEKAHRPPQHLACGLHAQRSFCAQHFAPPPARLTFVSIHPGTRNRARDHLIAAVIYSQMLYQLSNVVSAALLRGAKTKQGGRRRDGVKYQPRQASQCKDDQQEALHTRAGSLRRPVRRQSSSFG